MKYYLQHLTTGLAFVLCCLLAAALPAKAETNPEQNRWEFAGSAYLWAAGVKGTTATSDDIDVSFTDLLENLDGGLMGILAAQKGRWTLIADILYLRVHEETSTTANLIGIPVKLDVDVKLKGFVSTLGVAYRIIDDDMANLDLMVGARYFKLDLDFDADVGGIRSSIPIPRTSWTASLVPRRSLISVTTGIYPAMQTWVLERVS